MLKGKINNNIVKQQKCSNKYSWKILKSLQKIHFSGYIYACLNGHNWNYA